MLDPQNRPVRRALISVSDKDGIEEFAAALARRGVESEPVDKHASRDIDAQVDTGEQGMAVRAHAAETSPRQGAIDSRVSRSGESLWRSAGR